MTKKKTTATHTQAKGRTTHGKPGGRTAARTGAGTKRAVEPENTPAKAAAQKPRRAVATRRTNSGGQAGIPEPAETPHDQPSQRGLARLKEQARNMVEKDARDFLKGLKEKARNGSANDIRLLVNLAGLTDQKPAANRDDDDDDDSRMKMLRDLATQPEYQETADDAGNPQYGDSLAARGAGENSDENGNGIP